MSRSDARPEVTEALSEAGLAEHEARLVVSLYRNGAARASTLAAEADLSRQRTYRALEGLVERSLVLAEVGHPRRFRPVSPEDLFALLAEEHTEALRRVGQARERVIGTLHAYERKGESEPLPTCQLAHGHAQVRRAVAAVVDRAGERLDVAVLKPGSRLLERPELLRILAGEGAAAVRILHHPGAGPGKRSLAHGAIQLRETSIERPLLFLVADGAAVAAWADLQERNSASNGATVVNGDAPGVAVAYAELFERLWEGAKRKA